MSGRLNLCPESMVFLMKNLFLTTKLADIVHLSCTASDTNDPEADLTPYVAQLFPDNVAGHPTANVDDIACSVYFTIPTCGHCCDESEDSVVDANELVANNADGIHYACGPHAELDYERSIGEARRLFGRLFADEEFLPRAPDPDEIVAPSDEDNDETGTKLLQGAAEIHIDDGCGGDANAEVVGTEAVEAPKDEVGEEAC